MSPYLSFTEVPGRADRWFWARRPVTRRKPGEWYSVVVAVVHGYYGWERPGPSIGKRLIARIGRRSTIWDDQHTGALKEHRLVSVWTTSPVCEVAAYAGRGQRRAGGVPP